MRNEAAETPTIPVSYCLAVAREVGVPEQRLDELLGDAVGQQAAAGGRNDMHTARQLINALHNAVQFADKQAIGLDIGRALSPGTHGYLGFLAMASPDLHSALEAFGKYAPSRVSFVEFPAHVEEDLLVCDLNVHIDNDPVASRCATEACAIVVLQVIQFVLGEPLTTGSVELTYPKPDYADRYREFIQAPLIFSAPANRVTLPLSLAATRNAFADHQNYELALNRCQALLQELNTDSPRFSDRVRSTLLSSPIGRLSEEAAAAQLFISKRTMARRLKREGSSFRALRDDVLGKIALTYLHESHLSVESIAEILNYHDSASFRRAFKRWYGQTPQDYRQSLQQP